MTAECTIPDETTGPAPCPGGFGNACSGPPDTFVCQGQFRTSMGEVNAKAVMNHIDQATMCRATTFQCVRGGCSQASGPVNDLIARCAKQAVKSLGWPLTGHQLEEAVEEAMFKGWELVLKGPNLDPRRLLSDPRPLSPLLKQAMRNKVMDWRRHRDAMDPLAWGEDVLEEQVVNPDPLTEIERRDQALWAMQEEARKTRIIREQTPLLKNLLLAERERLAQIARTGPRKALAFQVWFEAKLRGERITQQQMTAQLRAGHGIQVSQPTMSRYMVDFRQGIRQILTDPQNGLHSDFRDSVMWGFLEQGPAQPDPDNSVGRSGEDTSDGHPGGAHEQKEGPDNER